jgi:alpha-1,4-digalacturonate transport system permease protein
MSRVVSFLTRRRGGGLALDRCLHLDLWLIGGVMLMFGPALWLALSSFKTPARLPSFRRPSCRYATAAGDGRGLRQAAEPVHANLPDGSTKVMAEVRRIGFVAQMVDPAAPGEIVKVNIADREPVREVRFATENYTEPFAHFDFLRYF